LILQNLICFSTISMPLFTHHGKIHIMLFVEHDVDRLD
jgi:hypothetical protein